MVELSPTGEIASFLDVNQFQPGRTQFACGFFACAIVKSMSPVHQQPTQTAQEMIAEAEQWYAQFDGDNSMRNMDGMSLEVSGTCELGFLAALAKGRMLYAHDNQTNLMPCSISQAANETGYFIVL